ncbi:MAG: PAS domain S-box protein [Planctomycetaceae bacterium]|nr:PAS domain S-box protein [Planctomycetaceae bacterium]
MQDPSKKIPPTVAFEPGKETSSHTPNTSFDFSLRSGASIHNPDDFSSEKLIIEGFKTGCHIATGGQGVIFSAIEEKYQREVAVKVLSIRYADSQVVRERFFNESKLTANLQHPGIVPVYNSGLAADGRPFFSMRKVEGESLAQAIAARQSPKDDLARYLRIFLKVCHTISYCHDHGVIHCDMKPDNVMLGTHGEVILMDFGLAIRLDSLSQPESEPTPQSLHPEVQAPISTTAPTASTVFGTPQYMAPEQAQALRSKLSERTDVFGLGAILYEILVGEFLYKGDTPAAMVRQAANAVHEFQRSKLMNSGSDPQLVRLCLKCLQSDPLQRPAQGKDVAQAIAQYLDSLVSQAESDLDFFFNLSPDLFCIANHHGEFVRVNPNFSRVLGYSDEEILAVPFLNRIHPDDINKTVLAMQELREGKSVANFVNRFQTHDGDYCWFEWSARSMPETGLIFAAARDVTSMMQDRLFSKILDVTPRALVVIDNDGRIVMVNETTEELFGFSRDELVGELVEKIVPDYIRARHVDLRSSYLQAPKSGKGPRNFSFITTRDGIETPVELELSSLETEIGNFAVAWIKTR